MNTNNFSLAIITIHNKNIITITFLILENLQYILSFKIIETILKWKEWIITISTTPTYSIPIFTNKDLCWTTKITRTIIPIRVNCTLWKSREWENRLLLHLYHCNPSIFRSYSKLCTITVITGHHRGWNKIQLIEFEIIFIYFFKSFSVYLH